MKTRSTSIVFFAPLICLLGALALLPKPDVEAAQSPPTDVGLITLLSGNVTYSNEASQKTPNPAQVFMKLRRGDSLNIPSGGLVQLVYFQNGRKEMWKGPVSIVLEEAGARAREEKGIQAQAEVVMLPIDASQGLRRIPVLLDQARLGRSGVVQVRGPEEGPRKKVGPGKHGQMEISRAREAYQKWREQSAPEDITPELNLLGTLAEYRQYGEMEKVVQDALKRQPDNEALKELEQWVRGKLGS